MTNTPAKTPAPTVVSEAALEHSRPWTQLRGAARAEGLKDGEEALFRSAEERDEFYRRALYGDRFNTAAYLRTQREFNRMMFVKAALQPGGRVLLIGEALEPIQLVEIGKDTVAAGVEIVPVEMRHLALAHKSGRWPVYRELAANYREGEFDAVIAAQWHHCDELVPEFRAMASLVKAGGKLVLVDNGPAQSTFELAKQDVLLDYLLRQFVTWAGARHVPAAQAFDYQKATWLKDPIETIVAAAAQVLSEVSVWEYKGMAMVDGVRAAPGMTVVAKDGEGIRLGIDVGGTFTDAVLWDEVTGAMRFAKVLSTPGKFADGVIAAAHEVLSQAGLTLAHVARLVHGSTVAANVVAERRGAKVGLLTTLGFRDVLELQRTRRDVLFDLYYEKPKPIVPRHLRMEVPERMDAAGQVLTPLDESAARAAILRLKAGGCRSIAVCFLFSFLNPAHERRVKDLIAEEFPGAFVSLSSSVNPEFREYERTSTTVVDAYIRPEVTAYYDDLERRLREQHGFGGRLDIVHSGGGVMAVRDAADRPVKTIESGPAAGAIAAAHISRLTRIDRAIALDMGGTTAKACLIENGRLKTVNILKVERHPVRAPLIDLVEISGGGGTLAWIDASGLLRLGPRSAGAMPGPACYGRGGELPTITDANVVLGYYPVHLTGGSMQLDADAARRAVRVHIAERLGMTEERAALGILRIANADMEGAIRLVSTQRGIDPRQCKLIAFGGAGPVHAAFLAQQLGIPQVLIPPAPGNVNAFGALVAETRYDRLATFYRYLNDVTDHDIDGAFRQLESGLLESLADLPASDRTLLVLERYADLRYVGQGYEITVAMPASRPDWKTQLANAFHEAHQSQFRHAAPGSPLQFVALRTVASLAPRPVHLRVEDTAQSGAKEGKGARLALFPGSDSHQQTSVWQRAALSTGWKAQGPAIVEEFSSTTVIPPGCDAEVDPLGNLLIHIGKPTR